MTLPYRHATGLVGLWLFLVMSSLCIHFYIPIAACVTSIRTASPQNASGPDRQGRSDCGLP